MRGSEPQRAAATAAPTETNDSQHRKAKLNTAGAGCVLHRGLPCCGQKQLSNDNSQLICSSCAPCGIRLVAMPVVLVARR